MCLQAWARCWSTPSTTRAWRRWESGHRFRTTSAPWDIRQPHSRCSPACTMSPAWSSMRRPCARRASSNGSASTSSWPATKSIRQWSPSSRSCTTKPNSNRISWAPVACRPATSWLPSSSAFYATRSPERRRATSTVGAMKVDGGISLELSKAAASAKEAEAAGYDGAWTAETAHDPFLPHVLAAEHTERLELGTSIAVAFARNPMNLANLAWDLQSYSKGRFILGLGSQIKPHITKRFSMEWSHPAPRMRELILAIRAIWDTWQNGTPLAFRGEFYTHTLMTPFFAPDRKDLDGFGVPKIFLAGVGELMTEVAGEVCDGFICHGFTTERYLREITLPALARGRAKAGKSMDGFEVVGPSFVVTGNDEAEMAAAEQGTRQQIAFYGSTPAYKGGLELHGWNGLHEELNALSKKGGWVEMGNLITDEILNTFAVVGEPEQVAPELLRRYGDVVGRISFYAPYRSNPDRWRQVMADLQAA